MVGSAGSSIRYMLDSTTKFAILTLLALLATALVAPACVVDAPPPDLGECAEPPDSLGWEFGEIGIGTCIASPSDLRVRPDPTTPDNHFLLVANSNSRSNFSGSSVLSIDASSIDLSCPVNGMHELEATALTMQEFAGRFDFDDVTGMALLTNRYVGGFEGELSDAMFVLDASDPRHLTFHDAAPRQTGPYRWIRVAADPWSVRIDPWRGRAWVLGLTDHVVFALDLVSDPIGYVDLHGERSLGDPEFEDLDGSGSSPDFDLIGFQDDLLRDEVLSLTYAAGATRLYWTGPDEPGGAALYQADSGDGATFIELGGGPVLRPHLDWTAGGIRDVTVARSEDRLHALVSAADADGRRTIGRASTSDHAIDWALAAAPAIEPTEAGWDAAGVFDAEMVREQDGDWHVTFAGGAGLGQGIGHLRGSSLDVLARDGDPLLTDGLVLLPEAAGWDAVSVSGPSLIRHGDTGEWLLFYSGHADDLAGPAEVPLDLSIGLARSDDARAFLREDSGPQGDARVLLPGAAGEWDSLGVAAPSVFYDNGRFQMWYQGFDGTTWQTGRATSVDGLSWERDARNPVFDGAVDADGLPTGVYAYKASAGGYYQVEGTISGVVGEPAWEGAVYESIFSPLLFQVVGGQALGRGEVDSFDVDGVGSPAPAADDVVLYVGRQGSFRRLAAGVDLGAGLERLAPVQLTGFEGVVAGLAGVDPLLPLNGVDAAQDGAGGVLVAFHTDYGISLAGGVLSPDDAEPTLAATAPGVAFGPGEPGEFDGGSVLSPSLVALPDGGWRMYYEGKDDDTGRIGLATSSDGVTWTREGERLERGAAGAWDDAWVAAPTVVFDGASWHLWYAGGDGDYTRIGYATSADGLTWVRHTDSSGVSVPVLEGGVAPFAEDDVSHPSVRLLDSGDFEMWFEGRTDGIPRVGRARSTDGATWTLVTNPTTAGDRFTIVTRAGDDSASSGIELGDDRSSPRIIDGFPVHGAGASEMILTPDGRHAIVANKRSPDLMVLDLYDDSDGDYVDSNFNDIEAILRVPQRHGFAGMRDMVFDSRGRLWVLMAPMVIPGAASDTIRYGTEGLVEINWDLVVDAGDQPEGIVYTEGTVRTFVPLARGIEEDQGYLTEVSVGPSAMEINADGDRAYVVNFNHNSLYIVDLDAGARGNVLAIVDTLDENPWEVALSPDEKLAYVANYFGVGDVPVQHSTLQVVDVDETSPTFGRVLTRLSNVESRSDRGCP